MDFNHLVKVTNNTLDIRLPESDELHEDESSQKERVYVRLVPPGRIYETQVARKITKIFKRFPFEGGYCYNKVISTVIDSWWETFTEEAYWDRVKYSDKVMRNAFEKKLKERYYDTMTKLRNPKKTKKKPEWVPDAFWIKWNEMWKSRDMELLREQAKVNRRGGDRNASARATHVGGSCSAVVHASRKVVNGIAPSPHALFLTMHQRENLTFASPKDELIDARYRALREEVSYTGEVPDEYDLYIQASQGPDKRQRIRGLGSAASEYYNIKESSQQSSIPPLHTSRGEASSSRSSAQSPDDIRVQMEDMKTFIAQQQQKLEEFDRWRQRQKELQRGILPPDDGQDHFILHADPSQIRFREQELQDKLAALEKENAELRRRQSDHLPEPQPSPDRSCPDPDTRSGDPPTDV